MKATLQVLIDARKLIEKPENWGKGRRNFERRFETCCAAEAIEESPVGSLNLDLRMTAYRALRKGAGLDLINASIVDWNDAPERTHAEVLAAFDRAIEAERAKP